MARAVTYQHTQSSPASVWQVNHNLNNYPIVDVMISYTTGELVKIIPMDIRIIDMNNCEIHFSQPQKGQARMV
jgi:hypothetical protein